MLLSSDWDATVDLSPGAAKWRSRLQRKEWQPWNLTLLPGKHLWLPMAGIISPYKLTIALQKGNGAAVFFNNLAHQAGIIDRILKAGAALSHHHGIGKMFAPWYEGILLPFSGDDFVL